MDHSKPHVFFSVIVIPVRPYHAPTYSAVYSWCCAFHMLRLLEIQHNNDDDCYVTNDLRHIQANHKRESCEVESNVSVIILRKNRIKATFASDL